MTTTDVKIRFAYTYDYESIIRIANTNGITWNPEEILDTLKQQWTIGIVAVSDNNDVLGFCIYTLNNPDNFSIIHLAVDPAYYRQGIGTKLIEKIKHKMLTNDHRNEITYSLPESNLSGQLFLKKMGFTATLLRSHPEDIMEFICKKETE